MNRRNTRRRQPGIRERRGARGFTLIELMVAMLLGLIVIAGVSSVFLANLRSYHANTALGDVQSNARIAFELMARDIRQAGPSGCNARTSPNAPDGYPAVSGAWQPHWIDPIKGFDATMSDSAVTRVPDTDSLRITGTTGVGATLNPANAIGNGSSSSSFKIVKHDPNLSAGNWVMVCNPMRTAIFQVKSYSDTTVGHDVDFTYSYGVTGNAELFRLTANDWYIGHYSDDKGGGSSLYRLSLHPNGTMGVEEMVRDVTNMQIRYHTAGGNDFEPASNGTDWTKVDAVRIELTLQSGKTNPRVGTDGKSLERTFTATTTLRNRVN
jgi:type IV pilus assembly protein PilW